MTGNRLYKYEKLCSRSAIDKIFKEGYTIFAYPLRASFIIKDSENGYNDARFLITVPKKKLRHAVDRVQMRRRIREAYRLSRSLILPALDENGKSIEIAFIYLSDSLKSYQSIETKIADLLNNIASAIANTKPQDDAPTSI
ncbi:MAG: ribonuclease P protein component [Muribaculaceae bacterium]|nr:ribonuclease P protein component [Muribaculaceae bacterium]